MALTGARIVANIYGVNKTSGQPANNGYGETRNIAFGAGVQFYAAKPVTTIGSVTIGSVIEIVPSGLNVPATKLFAVETPAQLISGGS